MIEILKDALLYCFGFALGEWLYENKIIHKTIQKIKTNLKGK